MSRIARYPIVIPSGIEVAIEGTTFTVKGSRGLLKHNIPNLVQVKIQDNILHVSPCNTSRMAGALAGTTRAQLNNHITGINKGFECQLLLVGVGYRAQIQDKSLYLNIGYSHPVVYDPPKDILLEVLEQTKVYVKGLNKQQVYQVAAEIRSFRPPEPYKGKGIRYATEKIKLKETKKK